VPLPRGRRPPPWALTALLAVAFLRWTPPTTDLAAQEHRVALARDGVWLLDLSWFGGHHLPSYSVLFPPLGALLGAAGAAALAAVVAAWAFDRLARRHWPPGAAAAASWWFAAGVGGLLFTGRATFLLGAAVALLTLLAVAATAGGALPLRRWSAVPAAIGGVATALASPVAALFLALAGLAWALARRGGGIPGLTVAGSSLGAATLLSVAFPGGGSEPFVASALWPAVAALAAALVVLPRRERALRTGAALYLAAVLLAGVLDTPMGGNATRLAALVGGPLLAGGLLAARREEAVPRPGPVLVALAGLLALGLLYWQWYPPVRDATQAWRDRSARASYWAPLARELRARLRASPARVEVPPTVRRGEARWLSPDVPLARGWIRQLDRDRHPLFYDDRPLTAERYRRWLDDQAIRWVALPDEEAEPDHASRAEVALLRDPVARRAIGLRETWRAGHWTLWETSSRPLWRIVDDSSSLAASAMASAPGVRSIDAGGLRAELPGSSVVDLRIRWSRYLQVTSGDGCLGRAPGGWTRLRTGVHGTVTLGAGLPGPWRRAVPGCG